MRCAQGPAPELPRRPYAELKPEHRWFPADGALRASSYERLLPPLVTRIRDEVQAWRSAGCAGATDTLRALLRWWFGNDRVQALQRLPDGSLFNSTPMASKTKKTFAPAAFGG